MDDRTPGIRPRQTVGRRLDAMARWVFPTAMTLALVLLTAAPFRLPGQAELQNAAALLRVPVR